MKRPVVLFLLIMLLIPGIVHALTLEEGLKIVAATGRDASIARSNEEAARSGISVARAAWLPKVDAYGYETWLRYEPAAKFGPTPVVTAQDKYLTYGVTATQLLYDFGRTSSAISAAQYGTQAREIETMRVKNRAAMEFIIAYYDLLESEKMLTVAGEEVQRYEAHKQDADARYGAGVVTKNEVLQADVTLADALQRYLSADNLRSIRASRINSQLLRPLSEPIQTEETTTTFVSGITLDAATTAAEADSPEMKILDASIKAKEESISAVQAEYLPTFYLSGGYQYQENEHMVHEDNWSLIAGVTVNLLSGGSTRARASMGRSELLSLRFTRDKIADAVRLDVKSAYLDVESSSQKRDVARAAVAQAEENLRLQSLRYQEGVGTATEVLDAVSLLSTAESNLWKALYGWERAGASLLYAMGRDLVSVYGKSESGR
ncbi:MAG TPA: TolC family protein [Nitrospirota bacterium]